MSRLAGAATGKFVDGSEVLATLHPMERRWLGSAKVWALALKRDVVALWIAARDGRTPFLAKLVAGAVAAYALSPIDLIPDVVPVLGLFDDILIVPLGILLAVKLVPPALMAEYRAAAVARKGRPVSKAGLVAVVAIWIASAGALLWVLWSMRDR